MNNPTRFLLVAACVAAGAISSIAQTPKETPKPAPVAKPPRPVVEAWKAPKAETFKLNYRKSEDIDDIIASHASFEYATQDVRLTWNLWDIGLQGDGTVNRPYRLSVRIVADDKSEIFDLGAVDFDKASAADVKNAVAKADEDGIGPAPVATHVYLVHTKDDHADFWTKVRVDDVVAQDGVTITWRLLSKPQRFLAKQGAMSARQLADFYAAHGKKAPDSRPAKKP